MIAPRRFEGQSSVFHSRTEHLFSISCPFCGAPVSINLKANEWQCDRCGASGSLPKLILTSPHRASMGVVG